MAVRFINRLTGGEMWVDETRVDEYKAAGHVPAAEAHPEPEAEPEKPVKKSRKKSTKADTAGE